MEHSVGLILLASTRGASREILLEGVKQTQAKLAPELRRLPNPVPESVKKKA